MFIHTRIESASTAPSICAMLAVYCEKFAIQTKLRYYMYQYITLHKAMISITKVNLCADCRYEKMHCGICICIPMCEDNTFDEKK